MNKAEVTKEVRAMARAHGLTFKIDPRLMINNKTGYMFIDRKTKAVVLANCTLATAYENCCNGYICTYNTEFGGFTGL
jgi:hypothetical protein